MVGAVSRTCWNFTKIAISEGLGPSTQQNRFADANRPQQASEVTRRDGLSSWRVILLLAAGMLSGKAGAPCGSSGTTCHIGFSKFGLTNSFWLRFWEMQEQCKRKRHANPQLNP